MFFDVGFSELFLLAVLGLLILGPERLPAVARTLGGWVRRGRQMASEFQSELEREVDLTEIKQLKNEVEQAAQPFRDAAETLDEGNSILDKSVRDLSKPVTATAADIPETLDYHAPMPSTESSDLETDSPELIDVANVETVVAETVVPGADSSSADSDSKG